MLARGSASGLIDDIGRAAPRPLHAHVERPVEAEGKAALGLVELHGRHADVEHDAVESREILSARRCFHLGETGLREDQPAAALLDKRRPAAMAVGSRSSASTRPPAARISRE